ncbi:YeeE/YedE family protein [Magnetospirillum aberrantis]|uniref:YeeE/YedE family protein n=1 Tax=Magnetospirillum aberrantis SpK TaxID=908842 RepID=A0A7C9QWP1_9PROT|nr:YeeE/YedE family protein [Magnetospirillum aberrantis SpK]
MTDFSPWTALAGGAMIGAAAVLLMLLNGRIMGVAGIVGGLLGEGGRDLPWRLAFVVGMVAPGVALGASGNLHLTGNGLGAGLLVVSGLLVGFGTRMGNGCTSGHGICGLARLSRRSAVAVVTFMAVTALVVLVRRHLLGG